MSFFLLPNLISTCWLVLYIFDTILSGINPKTREEDSENESREHSTIRFTLKATKLALDTAERYIFELIGIFIVCNQSAVETAKVEID